MADYQDRALLDISDILKKADIVEERLARAFAVKTGQVIQTPTLKVDGAATRQLSELDAQVNNLGKSVRATRAVWQTQALSDDETVASSRRLRDELLKLATAEDANIDTVLRATNAAAQAQRTMDQARGQVTKGGLAYNASLGIIDALGSMGGPAGAAAGLVGQYVVQGLTRSLGRGKGAVGAEADGLSDEIVNTLKAKLKIQSPSVVMEEIGRYIMEGLLSGFKSGRESVLGAVREVAGQIPNTFRTAAEGGEGLDGGSLVAPLVGGLESGLLPIPGLFQKVFGDLAPVAAEALGEVESGAEEASLNIAPAFDGMAAGFEKASGKLSELPAAAAPATAAVSEAAAATGEAGAQAEEAGNGFEQLSGILGIAAVGVTAFGAALAVAVPKAAEFQGHLAAIATESDLTTEQLTELGAGILDMSGRVGQSAQDLAQASYDVVGAGVKGADTIVKLNELTEISAKAASAGLTEVGVSANVITSALNAYGLSVDSAQHVSDVFFKTTAAGKISFEQLASNMGEVLPKASTLGVSLEELGASAAALTSSGVPAAQAITGINAALDNILKPTEEAKVLSKELGLQFNAAALQGQGWEQFLNNVQEATGGNTELLGRLFGSTEAVNAIFALTSSDGAPRFLDALEQIRNAAGATDEAFEKQSDTLKLAQQQFAATADAFQIEFGLKFLPILTKATQGATELIKEIDKLGKNSVVQFALVVGGAGLAATAIFKVSAALRAAAVSSALFQAAQAAGGFKALIAAAPVATNGLTKLAAFIPGKFAPQLAVMNGALVNVVSRLGVFGQAGVVAGAAFTGWKIGEWIGDLKLFGDATTTVNDRLQDFFATTLYGADPQLIREAREAEETQQRKALATKGATEATIDSGAAERQLAEDTKRANAARAAELELVRQQKLALVELNKELGDRRVKLELEGKSEFLNDLDSLRQSFDDLSEKFKAPFYVNGQLDLSNPKLQEGLKSRDAQREAETSALITRELDKQADTRLKHERDVQTAKAALLKNETQRRRAEIDQQIRDVQASYKKEIDVARQNAAAVSDPGAKQKFLNQATGLEQQQTDQVRAIREKLSQDLEKIDQDRLVKVQGAQRGLLDAQAKTVSAVIGLVQGQRDRELELVGAVPEARLAIEERYGPQLAQLQAEQQLVAGQAARAQLMQNLQQQLRDAETAGSRRGELEKAARATYLAEMQAFELGEQAKTQSQLLAQEKRVQDERFKIFKTALDKRTARVKEAAGEEITALERTLRAERARAQANGEGSKVAAIDDALETVADVKLDNLKEYKTTLFEASKEASNLRSELTQIAQNPLEKALKPVTSPFDNVIKGAEEQLATLKKSFDKVSQPSTAETAVYRTREAELSAIVTTAESGRLQAKTAATAKYYRDLNDKDEENALRQSKRQLDLGGITLDQYERVLAADKAYWEKRRQNATEGSEDYLAADAKVREAEDEFVRLANERRNLIKDTAAFSREQLQTTVELATNDKARATALERLKASDQGRLADLNSEISKLQALGGHEKELLVLKRERAGFQKDLATRQREEAEHARALTQSIFARIDAENKLAEKQARTDAALAVTRQTALGSLLGQVGSLDMEIDGAKSGEEKNKLLVERYGLLEQILDLENTIARAPLDADRQRVELGKAQAQLQLQRLGLADDEVAVGRQAVADAQEQLRLAQEEANFASTQGTPDQQRSAGVAVAQAEVALLQARNGLLEAPVRAEERRLGLYGRQVQARLTLEHLADSEVAAGQVAVGLAARQLVLAQHRLEVASSAAEKEAAGTGVLEAQAALEKAREQLRQAPVQAEERRLGLYGHQVQARLTLEHLADSEVAAGQVAVDLAARQLVLAQHRLEVASSTAEREAAGTGVLEARATLEKALEQLRQAPIQAEERRLGLYQRQVQARLSLNHLADSEVAAGQVAVDLAARQLVLAQHRLEVASSAAEKEVAGTGVLEARAALEKAREQLRLAPIQEEERRLTLFRAQAEERRILAGLGEDGVAKAQQELLLAQAEQRLAEERLSVAQGQAAQEAASTDLASKRVAVLNAERAVQQAILADRDTYLNLVKGEARAQADLSGASRDAVASKQLDLELTRLDLTETTRRIAGAQQLRLTDAEINDLRLQRSQLLGQEAQQQRDLNRAVLEQRRLAFDLAEATTRSQLARSRFFDDGVALARVDLAVKRELLRLNAEEMTQAERLGLTGAELLSLQKDRQGLLSNEADAVRKVAEAEQQRVVFVRALGESLKDLNDAARDQGDATALDRAGTSAGRALLKLREAEGAAQSFIVHLRETDALLNRDGTDSWLFTAFQTAGDDALTAANKVNQLRDVAFTDKPASSPRDLWLFTAFQTAGDDALTAANKVNQLRDAAFTGKPAPLMTDLALQAQAANDPVGALIDRLSSLDHITFDDVTAGLGSLLQQGIGSSKWALQLSTALSEIEKDVNHAPFYLEDVGKKATFTLSEVAQVANRTQQGLQSLQTTTQTLETTTQDLGTTTQDLGTAAQDASPFLAYHEAAEGKERIEALTGAIADYRAKLNAVADAYDAQISGIESVVQAALKLNDLTSGDSASRSFAARVNDLQRQQALAETNRLLKDQRATYGQITAAAGRLADAEQGRMALERQMFDDLGQRSQKGDQGATEELRQRLGSLGYAGDEVSAMLRRVKTEGAGALSEVSLKLSQGAEDRLSELRRRALGQLGDVARLRAESFKTRMQAAQEFEEYARLNSAVALADAGFTELEASQLVAIQRQEMLNGILGKSSFLNAEGARRADARLALQLENEALVKQVQLRRGISEAAAVTRDDVEEQRRVNAAITDELARQGAVAQAALTPYQEKAGLTQDSAAALKEENDLLAAQVARRLGTAGNKVTRGQLEEQRRLNEEVTKYNILMETQFDNIRGNGGDAYNAGSAEVRSAVLLALAQEDAFYKDGGRVQRAINFEKYKVAEIARALSLDDGLREMQVASESAKAGAIMEALAPLQKQLDAERNEASVNSMQAALAKVKLPSLDDQARARGESAGLSFVEAFNASLRTILNQPLTVRVLTDPGAGAQKGGGSNINNSRNTTNHWGGISVRVTQQPGQDAEALADDVVDVLQRRADQMGANCP